MMVEEIIKTGNRPARIGSKFREEVERIKDERLANCKDKDRISTEKITNLIIKHRLWKTVSEHIINANEEEVSRHGHG